MSRFDRRDPSTWHKKQLPNPWHLWAIVEVGTNYVPLWACPIETIGDIFEVFGGDNKDNSLPWNRAQKGLFALMKPGVKPAWEDSQVNFLLRLKDFDLTKPEDVKRWKKLLYLLLGGELIIDGGITNIVGLYCAVAPGRVRKAEMWFNEALDDEQTQSLSELLQNHGIDSRLGKIEAAPKRR